MQVVPYLNFNGNCREAFEVYAKVLGGNIVGIMTYGEMPNAEEQCAGGGADLVMHACLQFDGGMLMASDCPPEMFAPAQGISVSVHPTSDAEAERIYNALVEGATTITMPLQETFWATRFGMFTDRFGTPWMINCSRCAEQ